MEFGRGNRQQRDTNTYTEDQVEGVLDAIGIDIVGTTHNDFLCYCPYHGNSDTPAFTVGLTTGVFFCFNASCGESGTLIRLVKDISKRNDFEAMRLISKMKGEPKSFEERFAAARKAREHVEIPQEALDGLYENFWNHQPAIDYMHGRGYEDETLRHFQMGYSFKKGMLALPVHTAQGIPVGTIGRSIEGKIFKNSKGMIPSQFMFNLHRAKRYGDTVVIVEAGFDTMKVHQAGYPNVVGTIGGYMNEVRFDALLRHFNKFIIFTDDDDPRKHIYKACRACYREGHNGCRGHNPGLALGRQIAKGVQGKQVSWAVHDYKQRYPHGKDPGDLTDDEIRHNLKNAVTNFEFASWNLPEHVV